jgi:putative ABC transport system substrate-binding protein
LRATVPVLLCAALCASAEASVSVAVVKSRSIPAYDQALSGFLAAFGPGAQVYDLQGSLQNGPRVAREVAAQAPAAVVAIGAKAAQVARTYLRGSRLIYCLVLHPHHFGLSGRDALGIPFRVTAQEQIQSLRRILPRARRVGLLANPRTGQALVREARAAALSVGVQLLVAKVADARDVPKAVEWLFPRVDALWLLPDATIVTDSSFRFLLLESFRHRLPVLAYSRGFVRAGALLALSPDHDRMGRAAAELLRRVLQGSPASELTARPPPARLIVNGSTARRLGLEIPPELAAQAEIVE